MDRLLKLVVWCALLFAAGPAAAQSTVPITLVHHFGGFTTGNGPLAPLVQAPDGSFYGTTIGSSGTIFRLVPAADPTLPGTVTTVHTFTATGATGAIPMAGLIRAADGSYYGTTSRGGASGAGTVYRMVVSPNGAGGLIHTVEVVHTFAYGDGWDSNGALFQDSDGSFYGTTTQGGTYDFGTVFRLDVTVNPVSGSATSTRTILHEFDGTGGKFPHGALIKAANGRFYGTTAEGGVAGAGTVYQMETDISGGGDVFGFVSTIQDLDFSAGAYPHAGLLEGSDGSFYGTTSRGGPDNAGSIFRLVPGWDPLTGAPTAALTVLHQFDGTSGAQPESALVRGQNGALYGTTKGDGGTGVSTLFRMTTSTNPVTGDVSGLLTVLHTFDDAGAPALGTDVHAGVVQAADGSFYGTAASGGTNGDGTIFRFADKLIPTLTWAVPNPIRYGTMLSGTELNATASYGGLPLEGTFDYSPLAGTGLNAGTHTLSVVFTPTDTATYASVAATVSLQVDPANPFLSWGTPAPILFGTPLTEIQLSAIAFAGTQVDGTYAYSQSLGDLLLVGKHDITVVFTPTDTLNYTSATKTVSIVVYQAAPSTGPVKLLHSFERLATANTSAGTGPYSALFQGADGSFYGTTPYGGGPGITGGPEGQGRVFRMDLAGTVTPLYSFASPGPAFPYAGLVQGADGKFYGAAYGGGSDIQGAVYRVDTSTTPATVTTLHDFNSATFDGGGPYLSTPTFGADGTLYGATLFGGTGGTGTFYQLDPGGVAPTFRVLHHLTAAEGINPWASLLQTPDGWFYAPVIGGNAEGNGAILRVNAAGDLETVHAFRFNNGYVNGRFATGKLIQGQDGYLYGTTDSGGGTGPGAFTCQGFGCGTVYRLDIHATPPRLTTLHTFTELDGGFPVSGLLQASDGFLYGTTSEGGDLGVGALFRLDPTAPTTTDPATGWVTGAVERLHTFDGATGATPWAALTQGSDGAIYGATTAGGDLSGGTIFKFKVPTLTWPAPAPIDDGVALGPQLNATASFAGSAVPGTYVYSPPAGTVLPSGTHRLSVTFTPTDTSTYFPAKKSVTITVGTVVPTSVTIDQAAGQSDPTAASPIQFAVTFSAPVTGFDESDLSFVGSTVVGGASITGGGAHYVVSVGGMQSDGTVKITIPAGAAVDAAGNATLASTSTDNEVTFDFRPPSVTINQAAGQPDPTNHWPMLFSVVFSEPVTGFDASDIAFTGSSGVIPVASVSGSGASYVVSLSSSFVGAGMVTVTIPAGAAFDAVGHPSGEATFTDHSVTFDGVRPTVVVSRAPGQANPTRSTPVSFSVVFSEPVIGFEASDVSLAGSSIGGTLVATVTAATPDHYTVLVTGMSGVGTVVVSVPADVAVDAVGNPSLASSGADNTVSFDDVPPTVTIEQAAGQSDPTNASEIRFSVAFSEPVPGLAPSAISLAGSTAFSGGGPTVTVSSGGGANYTVSVTGMNGTGDVFASIPAGATTDGAGNLSLASTSIDNVVAFDGVAPTVTVNPAPGQPDPTGSSPIVFGVLFSKPVTGFTGSDASFAGSTAGGALVASISGSGTGYILSVTGMVTSGSVVVTVPTGSAVDAVGNGNVASFGSAVTFDVTPPTATINQASSQGDPTGGSPIRFDVVFSESVTGFTGAGISFAGSTVGGTLAASVAGSGTTYTVSVTGMSGTGTVVPSVVVGAAVDAAGNPSLVSTSIDNSVTFDTTRPLVTIDQAASQADPTRSSPVLFTVSFSKPVTGFDASDVLFAGSTVGGTLVASVTGSGTSYTVSVAGMTGSGTVTAFIGPGAAQDATGNSSVGSTSVDNSVTFDNVAPTVTINQAAGQADPTAASPIRFTVLFSESVTGFNASDVSLAGSTVGGTLAASVTGSGASYTVSVTGMSGTGIVRASVVSGAAQDAAGNSSAASTTTDNAVTFDGVAPTVTINQAVGQGDPTAAGPIRFTVVFSELVTGFNAGDISFAGSAVGGTLVANVTGSGPTYALAVTGMSGTGTLRASVVAGAAQDAAGNPSAASTSTDNTVTFDNVRPTVTINQAPGQTDPAATMPVNFAVVFSEPVTGFTSSDVSFAGSTGSGTLTATVTGNGTSYTVAVTGLSGPGTITASVPAGVATDSVGNVNLASTSTDNSVSVTLTIARPDLVTLHAIFPTSVPAGSAVTVAEVTFNAGGAAAGASTTRYYLSPDPVWSTSDRLLASRSVGPLASGALSLAPLANVVIPAGTAPGGYYLLAVADADRVVVESNEANNVSARPLTVQ